MALIGTLIKCIRSLYHEPTARVKVNGSLTDRIKLKRSTIVIALIGQPDTSFPILMDLLEEYGHYSGYRLNVSKTQILALNYTLTIEKYKWRWDCEKIVNIRKGVDKLSNANYTQ